MLSPLVAKLLKQVDSWQNEAGHNRLPSPQSTLTDSEGLDTHDGSYGDKRDIMLEVRADLAKSQQEHADRMARIRQEYTDGLALIEANRKTKPKPAHVATAPTGMRRIVSWEEPPSKSGKSTPMQRRASADVLTYPREQQLSSTPTPLGIRPAFQHKVNMQRRGLPDVEELRASVEELEEMLETARTEATVARQDEASAARAEAHLTAKAMLASVCADARAAREETRVAREEARVSAEAEAVASGSVMELRTLMAELQCKLEAATEAQLNWENHKLQERGAELLAASGSQAKGRKAMLATASEARVSAEAELAAARSQVAELKAKLATAREEAREARQVAHRAVSEGACISAEAEVALAELRALASEMECKLEAAREVEHRRTATEAQLCRENQQLHARVEALLAELEVKPEVAVDLVLDELMPKLKTMQPNFGHPPSEPVTPARPMLPTHLRPVNLKILEQQARLMTQSADSWESAKVNERLELARVHNRHVAKMGPAATKMAWLVRGHLTRARLWREREAARVAELQRETERAWAKTLSRPAPNGRRGKLTRRQHVLEREAVAAYFNLRGLPPPDSEIARHARELAEAVKAHRAVIDARNEGILQGRVLVVDPREVREERLREEKLCKLRGAGFHSVDTQAHAPAPQVEGSVEELAEGGRNEEAGEGEEELEEEDEGWERVLDQTTGREYFWHNVTDEVRWTEPPELAAAGLAASQ